MSHSSALLEQTDRRTPPLRDTHGNPLRPTWVLRDRRSCGPPLHVIPLWDQRSLPLKRVEGKGTFWKTSVFLAFAAAVVVILIYRMWPRGGPLSDPSKATYQWYGFYRAEPRKGPGSSLAHLAGPPTPDAARV